MCAREWGKKYEKIYETATRRFEEWDCDGEVLSNLFGRINRTREREASNADVQSHRKSSKMSQVGLCVVSVCLFVQSPALCFSRLIISSQLFGNFEREHYILTIILLFKTHGDLTFLRFAGERFIDLLRDERVDDCAHVVRPLVVYHDEHHLSLVVYFFLGVSFEACRHRLETVKYNIIE